jgi:Zn-dependent peptidase ImmA (M78 family)
MRSKATATKQARKLLSQNGFNVDNYSCTKNSTNLEINLEEIAQKQNIRIIEEILPDKISGFFYRKNGNLAICINKDHGIHRKRFTLAHELGHHVLHSNESLHYDKNPSEEAIYFRSDVSSSEETEANHFAAELLMPQELVSKCIDNGITTIPDLADAFNVSEDAMNYRLINLGYL